MCLLPFIILVEMTRIFAIWDLFFSDSGSLLKKTRVSKDGDMHVKAKVLKKVKIIKIKNLLM